MGRAGAPSNSAARFGELSMDPAAFPLYAKSGSARGATSWSVALNWYLNHNVKCIFEYSQTAFSGQSCSPAVAAQDEKALLGTACSLASDDC